MDVGRLVACPGVLYEDVCRHILHLSDDVELAQSIETSALIGNCLKRASMLIVHLTDRMEPVVDARGAPLRSIGGVPDHGEGVVIVLPRGAAEIGV